MSQITRHVSMETQRVERAVGDPNRRSDAISRAQTEAFEAALWTRRREGFARNHLRHREIGRIEVPDVSSAELFGGSRALDLLDHVIASVLPHIDAADDIVSIARIMLEEEIARRTDLTARLGAERGAA